MKQKEILGSHFANAYECMKANELIESGPDPPRAVAHARLRRRRRSAPADARKQAPRQDLDPRRRRARGRGQDRRGPRRDPRGGGRLMAGTVIVPWYATGFRADGFEPALERDRRGRRCATARAPTRSTARATTATSSSSSRASSDHLQWDRYWDGPGDDRLPRRATRAGTRCRVLYGWWDRTAGGEIRRRRAGAATATATATAHADGGAAYGLVEGERLAQPCSSGAIVRPGALELLPVVLGGLLHGRCRRSPGRSCGSRWRSRARARA